MSSILDIFDGAPFSSTTLTDVVNVVPNLYGRVNQLGIFSDEPVPTTSVAIDIENGVLNLLPTRPRGGPPSLGAPESRQLKSFVIPHIPHDDKVLATDVQNLFARVQNNSALALETVLGLVNRKLISMRRKHAITLENMRMGALKGVITDYDGTTLLNLFTEFGITQKTVDFTFGTATTDIGGVVRGISGYIEDNLLGDTMTSVYALCSPTFFNSLVTHPTVKAAYAFYVSTQQGNPLRDDLRRGFLFQGVMFEEYRGSATKANEDKTTTTTKFVPDGDARFFPLGTTETFSNFWAPPDFIDNVNVMPALDAQVFVAPLERMKFGKGMDIHTESNPLPIVKRPALLVRGFSSN